MVFKCSKCSYKTASYTAMQRHYARQHPSKGKARSIPKGKQKKVYTYHGPPKRRRR